MACVAEEHRAELAIRTGDLQDRSGMIHRPGRIDADFDARWHSLAPIDRETGALPVFHGGWGKIVEGGTDDGHQGIGERVLLGGRENRQVWDILPGETARLPGPVWVWLALMRNWGRLSPCCFSTRAATSSATTRGTPTTSALTITIRRPGPLSSASALAQSGVSFPSDACVRAA